MKKMFVLVFMAVLVVGLAACGSGDSKDDNGAKQKQNDESQAEEVSADESGDAEVPDNKDYVQVLDMLKDAGLDAGEIKPGLKEDFDAKSAVLIEVDGEDQLPLQIFDMDPDSKNLKMAKDSGKALMSFEGEEGEIDGVLGIDHYLFFMSEGHPKQKEIYDLLKDKFKAEE